MAGAKRRQALLHADLGLKHLVALPGLHGVRSGFVERVLDRAAFDRGSAVAKFPGRVGRNPLVLEVHAQWGLAGEIAQQRRLAAGLPKTGRPIECARRVAGHVQLPLVDPIVEHRVGEINFVRAAELELALGDADPAQGVGRPAEALPGPFDLLAGFAQARIAVPLAEAKLVLLVAGHVDQHHACVCAVVGRQQRSVGRNALAAAAGARAVVHVAVAAGQIVDGDHVVIGSLDEPAGVRRGVGRQGKAAECAAIELDHQFVLAGGDVHPAERVVGAAIATVQVIDPRGPFAGRPLQRGVGILTRLRRLAPQEIADLRRRSAVHADDRDRPARPGEGHPITQRAQAGRTDLGLVG